MPAERLPAGQVTVPADPGPFGFIPSRTALLLIDMQVMVDRGGEAAGVGNRDGLHQQGVGRTRGRGNRTFGQILDLG